MQGFELEDLTLWLIRDAGEDQMWIDRWAVSYPVVQMSEVSAGQSIGEWQAGLQTAFERIQGRHIAVVAHGAGAAAFLAWLYRADILTRKKIANIILVPQHPDIFSDDAEHTFRRVRCPCRAAFGCPRTRGRVARLGAKTGRYVERPPFAVPASGQFERHARRLAVGHEADAGNVAGVTGCFIGISVNWGCKENAV